MASKPMKMKPAWRAPLIFWQQGSRQQPKNVAVFIFLLLGMIGTIKLVTAGHNLLLTLAGFATRLAQASAELSPLVKGALAAVLLIEAVFFVYATLRYNALNRPVTKYPDPKRVATTIARFCDLKPVFELEEFLEGWFFGRPITSIPRDNIEEFVAYGFYCLPPDRLSEKQRQKMDAFLEHAVERWGIQVSDGHDPSLKFMAHAWEPMRVHHKPLMAYLAAELVAKTAHMFLRLMGFRKADHGCISCWTAVPKAHSSDSKQVDDNESHPKNTITKTKTNDSTPNTKKCASGNAPNASNTLSATKAELNILHGNQRHHDTLDFDEATERKHGKTLEAAHIAAEHAIDAAVAATSAAAAAMTQQYPHEGQQYHVHHLASTPSGPTTVPSPPHLSPTSSFGEEEKQQLMSIPVHEVSPNENGLQAHEVSPNENGLQPGGSSTSLVPIVFLHGVGFGVLPYLHFIRDVMKACPASPVIVLEMPHVALRLCKEAAEIDAVAESAVNALKRLGAEKACFVGHSYGTFVISRILQLYPQNVDSVALMDPVCLLTCYPQLLYNFIYRRLSLATLTSPLGIFDAARFVCSRDLTISEAFCRKFHWSELMLWPQDLPDKSNCALICLSGRDDLVPSEMALRQYNGHRGVRLMYHPELGHGGMLVNGEWLAKIVQGIQRMVQKT